MQHEEWRVIDGHPLYDVSDRGRVRSWACAGHPGRRAESPRVLALRPDPKGYYRAQLGAKSERFIHHLVLEAFVGPRGKMTDARHLDGCRTNNTPSNLEWSTHAANMDDQYAHGTRARGARHGMAKLTDDQAREIYAASGTYKTIGERYGITASTVCNIKKRQKWTHLWSDVPAPSQRKCA